MRINLTTSKDDILSIDNIILHSPEEVTNYLSTILNLATTLWPELQDTVIETIPPTFNPIPKPTIDAPTLDDIRTRFAGVAMEADMTKIPQNNDGGVDRPATTMDDTTPVARVLPRQPKDYSGIWHPWQDKSALPVDPNTQCAMCGKYLKSCMCSGE